MDNADKPNDKPDPTTLNQHVSAADLKKIRGGIASPAETPNVKAVEKSDEDFPRPAALV